MHRLPTLSVFGAALLLVAAAGAQPAANRVLAPYAGDLVVLRGDKLVPFEAKAFLQAPLTVLYFGAGWCPDCRRFSPELVEAYNRQDPARRQFEVLLVSKDKSAEGMLKFMQVEKMPWPAVAFGRVQKDAGLDRLYSGHGIPCLSVLDQSGKLVLQSANDQDAGEVLAKLQRLAKKESAAK